MEKAYKPMVIAEIGCNHNGDKNIARKMVDAAFKCGVDAVKFQIFTAKDLISVYAPKADYQLVTTGNTESQLEMTAKLELKHSDYLELRDYAESLGLVAFATPFDLDSIEFLHQSGQLIWKIPSGEITNLPYLRKIGAVCASEGEIILSTGMSTISEIKNCLDILTGCGVAKERIVLLHCNTEYPTPDEDVNLEAILALKKDFGEYKIGYSDHSVGAVAAIGACALGVELIEKHFTLDKNMKGPDHKASANIEEMQQIVEGVRRMSVMKGSPNKIVTPSEHKNKAIARKSIVAIADIKAGDVLNETNISCKRPGNGISPMYWDMVLGRKANRDYSYDELISFDDIANQE